MGSRENAKRRVNRVAPVSKNGVRYEELRASKSRGFGQNGGVLVATDEKSGKELWTLQIYKTEYDPQEEQDVQDVFFTELQVNWLGTKLTIINERKKTFEISIKEQRLLK